jgi:Uma2 family endonuclease
MATLSVPIPPVAPRSEQRTVQELLEQLGDVPPSRVWLVPAPGTATEQDLLDISEKENRLFELVDGTLVEKPMGFQESLLAAFLIELLGPFVRAANLGLVTAPDATVRLAPRLVRIPDVAFFSWDRIPGGRVPKEPVPSLGPDLAAEILSASNTPREMARKRREYFESGARLVWLIDPASRMVAVFTSPDASVNLSESDVLDGGAVLPGFTLVLRDFFAELDRRASH